MGRSALRLHWFFLPALAVASGAVVVTRTADWPMQARLIEAALLFDLAVLLPALYFWCYRCATGSPTLRALALACTGIWIASFLVPIEHHGLLRHVSWVRYAAIGILLYVELRIVTALYWSVISGHKSPESAAADCSTTTGMPPQLAALLAREAAFWQRLLARSLQFIRGRRGR